MGYALEAVLAAEPLLRAALIGRASLPAIVVPLRQGLAMVPMTDELFDAVADRATDCPLGFSRMPGGLDHILADWSSAGPIGYVEAEFFGGVGLQQAAAWMDCELVFGPVAVFEGQSWPVEGSPISQLLVRLGVDRAGHFDEFDAVGLGERRYTEDWLR